MKYLLGIDIGSTTVKLALLSDATKEVLAKKYQRHHINQRQTLYSMLQTLNEEYPDMLSRTTAYITGSAGKSFSNLLQAHFVQEVNAVCAVVEKLYPRYMSVVDIGGQDSKIVMFFERKEQEFKRRFTYMNDKCAGGTGAVIDRIIKKLGEEHEKISAHTFDSSKLHNVASKCGIFAESDINSLQKQGISAVDCMNSLFNSIVMQNISTLTRGNIPNPPVLLIGGPNCFFNSLRQAWEYNFQRLWKQENIPFVPPDVSVPNDSLYLPAIGCALQGNQENGGAGILNSLSPLKTYLKDDHNHMKQGIGATGLANSGMSLDGFKKKYTLNEIKNKDTSFSENTRSHTVTDIIIGLDAGSTSIKAVVLDIDANLLYKVYRISEFDPIKDATIVLEELYDELSKERTNISIKKIVVTGYAKDVLAKVLHADDKVVETVAHLHAAKHYFSEVDVIVDVGGQDIKILLLKNGVVSDIKLNNQCSAGNGFYLQNTADRLNISLDDYADYAFKAKYVPEFKCGCAVFMESDIVHYQQIGWNPAEILAGLAKVLPKNIWEYISQIHNLNDLGKIFVLQGGTQRNLAALKAQVDYIVQRVPDAVVHVHPHCGETGAIGAALIGIQQYKKTPNTSSTFIGFKNLKDVKYDIKKDPSTVCSRCANSCERTFIHVGEKKDKPPYIVAACELGEQTNKEKIKSIAQGQLSLKTETPNFVDRQNKVFFSIPEHLVSFTPCHDQKIGVPRILNMYKYAPFFIAYLIGLGFKSKHITFSRYTSERQWKQGSAKNSADLCFPGKYGVGHITDLLKTKSLDYIFNPSVVTLPDEFSNCLGSHSCVVASINPEVMKASFTKGQNSFGSINYLSPVLHMDSIELLEYELRIFSGKMLKKSSKEHKLAFNQALGHQKHVMVELRKQAEQCLKNLQNQSRYGILFLAKPYHCDPGLNHRIPNHLQKLGYPIFTSMVLPKEGEFLDLLYNSEKCDPLDIADVWKYSASANSNEKIWAAKFAARSYNLAVVDFISFRCGHDATILKVIENILKNADVPCFSFHDMDQSKPVGSIKLRLETLDYALRRDALITQRA